MTEEWHDDIPDARLVSGLLREQLPELAGEMVLPSTSSGSSNWVFRVGERHAARLPRADSYTGDLMREARWLPGLAPELPVSVPDIAFRGEPSALFSRPWTVVSWVPGELPAELGPTQQALMARTLGEFLTSLHSLETHELIAGAGHWGYRCGEPVTDTTDAWADTAAEGLADLFDPRQVRRAWLRIRAVPPASMPSSWVHTDLSEENILVGPDGRLVGVIDFGLGPGLSSVRVF